MGRPFLLVAALAALLTMPATQAASAGAGASGARAFAQTPPELLTRMDSDSDGRVALLEYQDYLSRGFRSMDADGNGIVDLDEYPPATVNSRTRPLPLAQHHANLAATFRRQDGDGDGFLAVGDLAKPPQ